MKTEKLKKLKDNCKLTTKQISDLSGIPESTISRILSGQTDNPTFDSVFAIVQAGDRWSPLRNSGVHTARSKPSPKGEA